MQLAEHHRDIETRIRPYPTANDVLALPEHLGRNVMVRRTREIYGHDDPTDFFWELLSGCARTVKWLEDGRRHVGEFLWPGDVLGMDDLETYYADAEAVTDVTLRRYPRRIVESYANTNAALALRLRMIALANLQSAHRQIALLRRKTAMAKIASFLIEMSSRSATADCQFIELPMCRTDIADHLGLAIETVCRYLNHLERDGTVAIVRTGIKLRNRQALLERTNQADG